MALSSGSDVCRDPGSDPGSDRGDTARAVSPAVQTCVGSGRVPQATGPDPGDGVIDFASLTRAVEATGYDRDIEVEIFNEEIWATPGEQTLATMVERHGRYIEPHL